MTAQTIACGGILKGTPVKDADIMNSLPYTCAAGLPAMMITALNSWMRSMSFMKPGFTR
jgi:hypothetical protein